MGKTITSQPAVDTTKWYYCTLLFLVLDYGRPQDLIPGLGMIRPAMIMTLVLTIFLIKHRAMIGPQIKQLRMIWYFVALLGLFVPFARNGYYAYVTFRGMLSYMPFVLSVVVCVNSMDRLKTFMKLYVGLMVYVAIYALLNRGVGSGNYFSDENDVSMYIDMVIPFCYFLFLNAKNARLKLFFATALVIGLSTVIVSFSRGGFVGLVVMFAIVWLVSPKKILSLFLILLLAAGAYFFTDEKYREEMMTVTDTKESTANARLMSWASGWDMFVDNPLGVGGGNFPVHFDDYQGDRFSRSMWGRVAHSLWFTLFPELGIVGIVIYFRLLFYNFGDIARLKTSNKSPNEDESYMNSMSVAFLASLAGFFASASFISVLYYPHYWYLTAILVATVRIRNSADLTPDEGQKIRASTQDIIGIRKMKFTAR